MKIRLVADPDDTLEPSLHAAIYVAKRLDMTVRLTFQGVDVYVSRQATDVDALATWNAENKRIMSQTKARGAT